MKLGTSRTLVRRLAPLVPLAPLALSIACRGSSGQGSPPPGASSGAIASQAPPAPKTVALDLRPAVVGSKSKRVRKTAQTLSVEFWKEGEKMGSNESSRTEAFACTQEVLGLVGGAPARVRMTCDRYKVTELKPGSPAHEDGALAGRTFLVDATDGPAKVTAEDGKPIPKNVETNVQRLNADLGKEDPLLWSIGRHPVPVGSPLAMREPLFRALIGTDDGKFEEGTVTPLGARDHEGQQAAAFEWNARMTSHEDNGLEVAWKIKGRFLVAISPAYTIESTLEADLDVTGKTRQDGAWIELAGSGSLKDDRSSAPL